MIHLQLNEQQFNLIVECLGNAPYRVVAPLLVELSQQVQAQRGAVAPAPPPEEANKGNGAPRV